MIAFSNDFDNNKVLDYARKYFDSKDILVRNHPGNPIDKQFSFVNVDNSNSSYEFIHRCSNILTINSSVGLEAVLLNRGIYILGDSPFSFLSKVLDKTSNNKKNDDELLKLNFFIFGYLIPFDLLFDISYLRWRLKNPNEIEIYNSNIRFYQQVRILYDK